MLQDYIFHIILLLISLTLIKFRTEIANFFKIMDYPSNARKIHLKPVPPIGGLVIFIYISASFINSNHESLLSIKQLLIWLFLMSYFFIVGFVDDRKHLNAKIKTFFLIVILFIILPIDKELTISALMFQDFKYIIVLNQGSLFFTIFCIFFVYNALNFADGANGVALGLCVYWITSIIIITKLDNPVYITILIALLIVILSNIRNQIFAGNSGVNFLSILFSLIFIKLFNNGYILFDQIILLVFLPSIDLVRIVIERLFNNKSPLEADQNHFQHLLMKVFSDKLVFIPYLALATIPNLLNIYFMKSHFALAASISIYFVILFFLKKKNV